MVHNIFYPLYYSACLIIAMEVGAEDVIVQLCNYVTQNALVYPGVQ